MGSKLTGAPSLSFGILDGEQVKDIVLGGQHWLFVFGVNHMAYIDLVDEAVGSPTATIWSGVGYALTAVRKEQFPKQRLKRFLAKHMGNPQGMAEQDILLITDSQQEALSMVLYMQGLVRGDSDHAS